MQKFEILDAMHCTCCLKRIIESITVNDGSNMVNIMTSELLLCQELNFINMYKHQLLTLTSGKTLSAAPLHVNFNNNYTKLQLNHDRNDIK